MTDLYAMAFPEALAAAATMLMGDPQQQAAAEAWITDHEPRIDRCACSCGYCAKNQHVFCTRQFRVDL